MFSFNLVCLLKVTLFFLLFSAIPDSTHAALENDDKGPEKEANGQIFGRTYLPSYDESVLGPSGSGNPEVRTNDQVLTIRKTNYPVHKIKDIGISEISMLKGCGQSAIIIYPVENMECQFQQGDYLLSKVELAIVDRNLQFYVDYKLTIKLFPNGLTEEGKVQVYIERIPFEKPPEKQIVYCRPVLKKKKESSSFTAKIFFLNSSGDRSEYDYIGAGKTKLITLLEDLSSLKVAISPLSALSMESDPTSDHKIVTFKIRPLVRENSSDLLFTTPYFKVEDSHMKEEVTMRAKFYYKNDNVVIQLSGYKSNNLVDNCSETDSALSLKKSNASFSRLMTNYKVEVSLEEEKSNASKCSVDHNQTLSDSGLSSVGISENKASGQELIGTFKKSRMTKINGGFVRISTNLDYREFERKYVGAGKIAQFDIKMFRKKRLTKKIYSMIQGLNLSPETQPQLGLSTSIGK